MTINWTAVASAVAIAVLSGGNVMQLDSRVGLERKAEECVAEKAELARVADDLRDSEQELRNWRSAITYSYRSLLALCASAAPTVAGSAPAPPAPPGYFREDDQTPSPEPEPEAQP